MADSKEAKRDKVLAQLRQGPCDAGEIPLQRRSVLREMELAGLVEYVNEKWQLKESK